MKIIIDANILFAALIRDSTTRRIILESDGQFLFPAFLFEEMEKHIEILHSKSGLSGDEFARLLQLILEKVLVIPTETLDPFREKAFEIIG